MNFQPSTRPTHLLLADDDNDDYEIFKVVVNDIPVATILSRVEDGEKLMEFLKNEVPDILFLDIGMPCKDGRTCIKQLRADSRYDFLPIIVYTSFVQKNEIEYFFRQGANLYLEKPIFYEDLKQLLEEILATNWKHEISYPPMDSFFKPSRYKK
ncbi:response regulator [Pollutibacter soli]|uniref:response regulator n=1 Tax=Pollutibacter soli TaxID=3034157 RepID=UPI003013F01C